MTDRRRPAVLGGAPAFPDGLPLVRPTVPDIEAVVGRLEGSLRSGALTNGPLVRELEAAVAERLGVAEVVGVSNCTAGLMLVYQAVGIEGRRVLLPSFTFAASAHAVVWAGGSPDFVDVDPERGLLDPTGLAGRLDGAAAVSATHLYGSPAPVEAIGSAAGRTPVVYDAAHALGSRRGGTAVGGFGAAEVFSLSPTKIVVAGEGGLVATNDASLAEAVRLGRDYGNPGDYDCRFPGLNARLSELHAAVALASLAHLDEHLEHREALVDRFERSVAGVGGLRVVRPEPGDRSTYKDLTLIVDEPQFGLGAAELQAGLRAEGIDSRRYYDPPIHRQRAYRDRWPEPRPLPVTDRLARRVLTPPLWSSLQPADIDRVATVIADLHEYASQVRAALGIGDPGSTIDRSPAAPSRP